MDKISLVMVGTGGYAVHYLKELFEIPRGQRFRLVAAVDPFAENSPYFDELKKREIPIYNTLDAFYADHTAQMAIISTPTYLHADQAICCMEHGTDVLCEKPLCATMEDAKRIMETRDRTGRKFCLGFQMSISEEYLKLKQDIMDGVYGKIKRFRTLVFFPRNLDYYRRGAGWGGNRQRPDGTKVYDSVAANATAHYLHNMFFLCGDSLSACAKWKDLQAEVYRMNPIEMFDTCALRLHLEQGTEVLFYASHAVEKHQSPIFVMEGELGTATLVRGAQGDFLSGKLHDGREIVYGNPSADQMRKMYVAADAFTEDGPLPCIPETAVSHLTCIETLADMFPETPVFPEDFTCFREEKQMYYGKTLDEDLRRCYAEGKLPCELEMTWSAGSKYSAL